jgi:hypothetical protein
MLIAVALVIALPIAWLAAEVRAFRLADAALMQSPDVVALSAIDTACLHPSEARVDTSTSGTWRWRCDPKKGGCGFIHEQPMRTGTDG